MRKIVFIISLFLAMLGFVGRAQVSTDVMVFGDVKQKTDGKHIPFAQIVLKGTRFGTMADASGHFKMVHLPEGEFTLVAYAMGFKKQEKTVVLKAKTAVSVFFELEDDVLNLEQVVVSGTRTPHFVKDAPVRTEVITARAIEQKRANNLYEVLEGLQGVRVENQCQACNFTMVRMQGLGPEHTQMLINGQAVYSGLASVYGLQQIASDDIERVEVVKGSGSALYGSHAIGGAINIISQEPSPIPLTKADLRVGNEGTFSAGFQSSMRNETGNLGLLVFARKIDESALDQTGPGLIRQQVKNPDGFSDRVESKLINAGISFLAQDMNNGAGKLLLRSKYLNEFRRGGLLTDDILKNPYTPGTENIKTDRWENELQYSRKLGAATDVTTAVSWVLHQREATNDTYLNDYFSIHGVYPDVTTFRPYLADENLVYTTLSLGHTTGAHHLLAGLQAMYDIINESGMYVNLDTLSFLYGMPYRSVAEKDAREWGVFLQDEWAVSEKLMLVPGLRLDNHRSSEKYLALGYDSLFPNTRFAQYSLNPRMAVKYTINEHLVVRANIGTGYRAPFGFSEDLHLCSGSPRVWKSSKLLPEKSLSYNVSADYSSHDWALAFNIFHTRLKNKIGFVNASPEVKALGYDYEWQNIEHATVQGIEVALKYFPVKSLELYADMGINRGLYDHPRNDWKGTPWESVSRYIPRFPFVSAYLKAEYSAGRWSLNTSLNFQGTMYIDYYNSEPDPALGDMSKIKKTSPYALWNVRATYRVGNLTFYAGVNNITGYIQDERHLDDAAFIYAPLYGRLFFGGLSFAVTQ
ncbi:MAG: TonB-dependent receptor [Bacteroidales bacterium]